MSIPIEDGFRFSPYAWQKWLWFTHRGNTEVGGFGILDEEDKNLIVDFKLVKQKCTSATIDIENEGLDIYLNQMLDEYSIGPNRSFRVYCHCHPGDSPNPSSTDWKTFEELMCEYPWFAMLIISRSHKTYGYVQLTQGPGLSAEVDISIDWSIPCEYVDFDELELEYLENVKEEKIIKVISNNEGKIHLPPIENKYSRNYQEINWSNNKPDLSERWKSENHNYLNSVKEDNSEFDLSEEELNQCWEEYLFKEKGLHEMSDEEFKYFSGNGE